jgi:opacity protein-like surface antigen
MLRYLQFILFLAAATTVSAAAGPQNIRGWYELGAVAIEDAKLESFLDEPLSGNEVEFEPGFRGAIGLGTELTRYLAVEVEGAFHYNSIESVRGASSGQGDLFQFPVFGNIVLHFPNRSGFVPVIGGGVGAVYSIIDADDITIGATTFSSREDTWSFAYQGYAGLIYYFRPEMALGLTYHYVRNDGPTWDDSDGDDVKFDRLVNHSLAITFSFHF